MDMKTLIEPHWGRRPGNKQLSEEAKANFIFSWPYSDTMADVARGHKGEAKFVKAFPAITFGIVVVLIGVLLFVM